MKTKLIIILIAIALALPVKAQQQYMTNQEPQDHDNAVGGAVAGAIVGGVVGNQLHHNTVAGVIVGGITGALIGNAIDGSHNTPKAPPASAPIPPPPVITPPPPPISYQSVNYIWGPLDRFGHPTYVFVQEWNGTQWITTYHNYNQFQLWYGHYWGRPYSEDRFRHYWHHR